MFKPDLVVVVVERGGGAGGGGGRGPADVALVLLACLAAT